MTNGVTKKDIVDSIVKKYNQLFGGENKIVDLAEEVDPKATDYFIRAKIAQYEIVSDLAVHGKSVANFFRTDLIEKLFSELYNFEGPDVTDAMRQLYYSLNSHDPSALPPVVQMRKDLSAENAAKLPAGFKYLLIFVNWNGYSLPVVITPEHLPSSGNAEIYVDGYVDSMLVVGEEGSKSFINEKKWKSEEKDILLAGAMQDRFWMSKYDQDKFRKIESEWPEVLRNSLAVSAIERSAYFMSTDFYSDFFSNNVLPCAFSFRDNFVISIGGYRIKFSQDGERPLSSLGIDVPCSSVKYLVQGDAETVRTIMGFSEKVTRLDSGISFVSRTIGVPAFKKVLIMPSQVDNMGISSGKGNNVLVVSTYYLSRKDPEVIELAAAHESLHKITNSAGLSKNEKTLAYYRDFFGGRVSDDAAVLERGGQGAPHRFLKFITEDNFYGMGGGHPSSNVAEFCVSFTHTLLDVDRLGSKLKDLPSKEREEILRHYVELTHLFGAEAKNGPVAEFYAKKYDLLIKF